jgi:hypothetical protein
MRSNDNGITWIEVIDEPIVCIAVNNEIIFAGRPYARIQGSLYKSIDNGDNWNVVMREDISSLALKGTTIFAGTYEDGIFRSTDNGDNWSVFNNGLTDTSIIALVYTTNENRVFAATPSGIFYTTVNGTKWYKTNAGFVGSDVTSLATDNDFIYAGLNYNGGVWRYSLAKMNTPVLSSTIEIPLTFSLYQNYPNPFNPVTKIRFDIPNDLSFQRKLESSSTVTLKIYDIIGREIQTLVNENLNPGTYEVTFDGSNFASGIYFYKLIAGDFAQTKSMILLK